MEENGKLTPNTATLKCCFAHEKMNLTSLKSIDVAQRRIGRVHGFRWRNPQSTRSNSTTYGRRIWGETRLSLHLRNRKGWKEGPKSKRKRRKKMLHVE